MAETAEKSTTAAPSAATAEIVSETSNERIRLDSRLAIYDEVGKWLAVSDLHYGYETSRRAQGGLWPMWGKQEIETRLDSLLQDYQPEYLLMNGDVVDSRISGDSDAAEWLAQLTKQVDQLVLIRGNHDKGPILREREWYSSYTLGRFVFHHGHKPLATSLTENQIEVIGHIHPAYRLGDGAGLSKKLPTLVQENRRWILPAFSPWAGGVAHKSEGDGRQWVCSDKRVFEVI